MKIINRIFTALGLFIASACISFADDSPAEEKDTTFADLFRAENIQSIELSPSGEFVAFRKGKIISVGRTGTHHVEIYRFRNDDELVRRTQWIGVDTLVVETWNRRNRGTTFYVSKMGPDANGDYAEIARAQHSVDGYIYDAQLENPDEIIFARLRVKDEVVTSELFQVNVFSESGRLFRGLRPLDTGSEEFFYYARDHAGNYIVGIRFHDGIPEIWKRSLDTDEWTKAWTARKESTFSPYGISASGNSLFALSNAFTDKTAAVELDLRDGSLVRTIYEHERFDLDSLLISDESLEPYGVVYTQQGMYRYHFFADDAKEEFQQIQEKFPDKGIIIIGRSLDSNVQLVHTSSSRDRGQIRRCNLVDGECEMLLSLAPWLDNYTLSESVVLQIDSELGVTVDAFLTLPVAGGDSIPLVAMPHGGPIGVSDSRYFSADTQWLAHNGYAVLQVNYRGSSGYGKDFVSAGHREWGRGIEDDIDAAVLAALKTYPQLDRDRVGIFGSSYGGYSALMSIIRNPDLYKCGASFAGVTDLTLLFAQSRLQRNPELREKLARIIGDPDLDYEEQTANSPVYRYKEIERPILLAHGTLDRVVDIEHSWRLRLLMRLRGIEPDFVVLDRIGHGFDYISEARKLYEPLVAFLDTHLKP